jgi:hypothetical protein
LTASSPQALYLKNIATNASLYYGQAEAGMRSIMKSRLCNDVMLIMIFTRVYMHRLLATLRFLRALLREHLNIFQQGS